jgi:hypothetical protein
MQKESNHFSISRYILSFFLLVSCIIFLVSCKSSQKAANEIKSDDQGQSGDSLYAAIERSPCFGRCPTYVISIYKSGYVVYEGKKWVDHLGFFYTFISSKQLAEIADMAKKINFDQMQDAYHDPQIMDAPSTFTSYRVNGKIKRIDNTYGAAPQGLVDFSKFLDDMFEGTNWIKIKENNRD